MQKVFSTAVLALVLMSVFVAGCAKSNTHKLTITGSSTVAPLAAELALAFEDSRPGVRIDVQTGGSSRGIADARNTLADIGMVSRGMKSPELDLIFHTIAVDGIALIVNSSNPVSRLSDEQVVYIYRGVITNWNQVGGPDKAITVINKAEGRSTLELFLTYFELENREIEADIVVGDNQQGIITVSGNPWAIAYVSVGTAEYEVKQDAAIKLLGVGGVAASVASIKSGQYPLSRPLNLVTVAEPVGLAKEFISFAKSPEAHFIIEKQFFIPVDNAQ